MPRRIDIINRLSRRAHDQRAASSNDYDPTTTTQKKKEKRKNTSHAFMHVPNTKSLTITPSVLVKKIVYDNV